MTANLEEIVQWLDNAGLLCWEWKSGRKRAVMAVEFSEREAEGNGAWVAVLRAYSHGPKPDRVTAIEHPVSREYFNAHMVYEGNTGCSDNGRGASGDQWCPPGSGVASRKN